MWPLVWIVTSPNHYPNQFDNHRRNALTRSATRLHAGTRGVIWRDCYAVHDSFLPPVDPHVLQFRFVYSGFVQVRGTGANKANFP
jgi:hypothetical protein